MELQTTRSSSPQNRDVEPSGDIVTTANDRAERFLTSRNVLKLICAGFSFFYAGTNDGTTGPLIPYMLRNYHASTALITVIYVGTFIGWFISALTNTHLTTTLRLSLGATLLLGAGLQLLAQLLRFWGPPFPLFVITFFLTALGQAYQDSYSNAFVAKVPQAHRWLGFIHAMYMLGCLTGPFVGTLISSHTHWYYTYAAEAGLGCLNLGFVFVAFRDDIFRAWKKRAVEGRDNTRARNKQAIKEIRQTLQLPSVWLVSLFFFFFLGAAITAGGWVVEYLVRVRHGDLSSMGYVPTGYYGGGFLGRLLLAEPTHRLGERRMIFLYTVICVALQVMFWTIPNMVAGAVLYSALGFFSGPFFVSRIHLDTPSHGDIAGFVFVMAQMGASLFPTVTGIIAANAGVKVLQPMLVGLFVLVGASWWLVPKVEKGRGGERSD
ncbi:hypothetical protein PV08_04843 [Exophiala spinifera]|uniref:Major facilitator superfamily (MFS) profile domain-containing protein n=1 Tax=Exophiala spinifera TaxID=91928 RepID=A0A0D2BF85_9EURO|nr:uncharacterized protein PV08_04843 [Exophiala spinifera]KIW17648.1 hypothetical protein PV08_04843 [Exophiala spinifera]